MICLDVTEHIKLLGEGSSGGRKEDVWNKILAAAQERAYAVGKLRLETVAVDSTLIDSKKVANLSGTTDISDARE